MSTTVDSDDKKVNWAIRLDLAQAKRWDHLLQALRDDTGHRTLSKAALFRAMLDLAETDAGRQELIDILTASD